MSQAFPKNRVWHFFRRFLDQCDAHWPARDHLINLLACLILPKVNFRAMWWTNDTPNSSKNANLGNKLDVPCPNSTYVVYVCMCKILYTFLFVFWNFLWKWGKSYLHSLVNKNDVLYFTGVWKGVCKFKIALFSTSSTIIV